MLIWTRILSTDWTEDEASQLSYWFNDFSFRTCDCLAVSDWLTGTVSVCLVCLCSLVCFLIVVSFCSSSSSSGPGPGVQQQFLVVSDGHQALSGQSLHSVALSYGTLPRAPRRAPPPSSTSSLARPRAGSSPAPPHNPQSLYATLSRPHRSATNGHYRQPSLPSKVNGSSHYAPHQGPPQPLRLDVPPESDWRRDTDYRTAPPSSSWDPRTTHHQQPPPARLRRDPQLCSLCQQVPAEPSRPYCPSCGAYVARFRPACWSGLTSSLQDQIFTVGFVFVIKMCVRVFKFSGNLRCKVKPRQLPMTKSSAAAFPLRPSNYSHTSKLTSLKSFRKSMLAH